MSFSRFLDHRSARFQFCAIKIQRCQDDECHCLINNRHTSNCSRYYLDTVTQLHCPRSELLDLMKNSNFSIRMIANHTIPDTVTQLHCPRSELLGLMAIHYILDLMKNSKFSIRMMATHTIPDLMKNKFSIRMMANHTIPVCLLLIFLHRSKIVKILKSLWHTNADPPDIQNDLHTTQHLMGEDENILNEPERPTNDMMTENRDGVSMSNWAFGQHNQIQPATTDTPKFCSSCSRIDA